MEDSELSAIRARRMAELQGGGSNGGESQASNQAKVEEEAMMRSSLLEQVLEGEAYDRLKRIALVKPSKARQVEDRIINLAKSGRLRTKVTEQGLIQFLNQINDSGDDGGAKVSKITFNRRKTNFDSDDDDEDYGL